MSKIIFEMYNQVKDIYQIIVLPKDKRYINTLNPFYRLKFTLKIQLIKVPGGHIFKQIQSNHRLKKKTAINIYIYIYRSCESLTNGINNSTNKQAIYQNGT